MTRTPISDLAAGLPRLYSLRELVAASRYKKETLMQKVRRGLLPAVRVGQHYLITQEVALAFLAGQLTHNDRRKPKPVPAAATLMTQND